MYGASAAKGRLSNGKEVNAARDKTVGKLYAGTYVVYANVRVKEFLEFWMEDIRNRIRSCETYDTFGMDVYGDNGGIIADCVEEIQPFIDEAVPAQEVGEELRTENMEIVIPVDFL